MDARLAVLLRAQPSTNTLIVDELDTSTALADLEKWIVDGELTVPTKSALSLILRRCNRLLVLVLLLVVFQRAIFAGLIRGRGLILLCILTGYFINIFDANFLFLIFFFLFILLVDWQLSGVNLPFFIFFALLFLLN